MNALQQSHAKAPSVVPSWQTLRFRSCLILSFVFVGIVSVGKVDGQIYDALDAHPPRWSLDTSDCEARILEHKHLANGGIDGRACEAITFTATNGSKAEFIYPIEPVRAIDDLNAKLSVMSARAGAQIGLRVRYPYERDAETRRTISTVIYGTSYRDPGKFRWLGIGAIEKRLRLKTVAVRQERGADADLNDPYIDAIVINAYSGAGQTSLRIDELTVNGMVSAGKSGLVPSSKAEADFSREHSNRVAIDGNGRLLGQPNASLAFPPSKITKILQHNGEPLSWVRSLGFDAVLLRSSPDAAILREAIQSRMMIYAPPPSSPDAKLQSLLEPVAAWYIGSGLALDRNRTEQTALTSRRLRNLPLRWQRPIVAAPAERWRSFAPMLDAMIDDLPLRVRGITADEEVAEMLTTQSKVGERIQTAVGIAAMPPATSLQQTESISRLIGAPPPSAFRWHSMYLQAMRSLESTPNAILFRSSRSLASGSEMDNQRSMALSYVNRVISMIAPWVAASTPAPTLATVGAPYRCSRLVTRSSHLLIASSIASRGNEVLAGDGETLDILLSPEDATKTAWRLTDFSAQRITPEVTAVGSRIRIVSPDVVELVVLSSDPSVGDRLNKSARQFAQQASLDRWQLTSDAVRRVRQNWNAAVDGRFTNAPMPSDLITVASRTLADAEPLFRAGNVDGSLRMARRADAWGLRCQWRLSEALMPDWPNPTSSPPMHCDSGPIQIAWQPLMQADGWGRNLLTTGSFDRGSVFDESRWTFGDRKSQSVQADVAMMTRGTYAGQGALRMTVTPLTDDPLPGGYEGTVIQVRSPSVRIPAGKAFRVDAMVRTLGFGDPHQGVLVYDSIGGQESGILMRGKSNWTPVRLYRQSTNEQEVHVMFEVIGAGEVAVDEVKLQIWEPKPIPLIPLSPIAETPTDTLQR